MSFRTAIGLDVGRSAVKVVANANGLFYRLNFPSIVSPAFDIADEATARRAEAETVEVHGKSYFVGDTARVQGRVNVSGGLSHDWTEGPQYLALVASAIKRLEARGVAGLHDPYIVIGTPAALFGAQKKRLEERTREVVKGEIKVLPQPMGAYLDFTLDPGGAPIKVKVRNDAGAARSWAVVEVGHFTTDFLLMREGQYVEQVADSCEGISFAVQHLVRILAAKNINTNPLEAERALQIKKIVYFGEKEIPEDVDAAAGHVVQKIMDKASALLSSEVSTLDGILLAGGGAPLVFDSLQKQWPHTVLLENPRMAVADGFCRYALGLLRRRAATTQPVAVNG